MSEDALSGAGASVPKCDCHGLPMYWQIDRRIKPGGFWYCAERQREKQRERYDHETRWRRYIAQERPRALKAERERVLSRLEELERDRTVP